ncbi:MAG: hypothetical protein II889_08460 [Clostridia bacterium]|nr:hypothetical protein [Clostridia bacterium]
MKRLIPLILVFALLLSLASCRNDARAEIENELESARAENEAKIQAAEELSEPDEAPAGSEENEEHAEAEEIAEAGQDAVKPEKQNSAGWDGILSSEYTVQGGKLYYENKMKKGRNTVSMPFYTDLKTLSSDGLCPDPLCANEDPAVCKYISVNSSTRFCFADDSTFYWVRNVDGGPAIWRYDLSSDTARREYASSSGEPILLGADDGTVWFKDYEQQIGNGRAVMQPFLKGLDVRTGKVVFSVPLPEMANVLFIRGGKAWLDMLRTVTVLDLTTGTQTELCPIPGTIGAWYYDTQDDSFWFSAINQENSTGSVWEYKSGACRQVGLPVENIYYFQLTRDRILFSSYEPAWLGVSMAPDHPPTYDYSGGKIWAVDREHPSGTPELLYDTEGKYVLCIAWVSNYSVFGNQLFFDRINITHTTVEEEDGTVSDYIYFDLTGDVPKLRVDLTTGEEELIRFE